MVYFSRRSWPLFQLLYTTEETEKLELFQLAEKLGGDIELAIKQLAESKRKR